MMISPSFYIKQLEDAEYLDLIEERDNLLAGLERGLFFFSILFFSILFFKISSFRPEQLSANDHACSGRSESIPPLHRSAEKAENPPVSNRFSKKYDGVRPIRTDFRMINNPGCRHSITAV